MKTPSIIVAVDNQGGFGKDGKIPWTLPEDLKRFRELTEGHVCVMGRRTYDEILDARMSRDKERGVTEGIEEVLRKRQSFVVTSREDFSTPGATAIKSLGQLVTTMSHTNDNRKLFVIGGRRLFVEALSTCREIFMTVLKGNHYDCDVKFPVDILNKKWKIVSGDETDNAYFVVYNRK